MWPFSSTSYKHIVESKQKERSIALGKVSPQLGSQDVYLASSASEIVRQIEKGEWTASEVLEAYIARAILAQETTNCLTEILFEQARKEAKILDQEFAASRKLKGPLHGVPVSFKDNYGIAGYDSTLGFTKQANQPAWEDAEIVALVRKAGGIPFVKTNLPQTMMFFECINPLWGRTTNPFSPHYSSGGSSGGEGALLGMDGSALGWGSDIGGSLRIPASWCGMYSLKPGHGRVSTVGVQDTMPGFEAIHAVAGPMGRSVDDLEIACRAVFGQQGSGYYPAPILYRAIELPRKLRFGYYISDCFVKASPVCQRAVLETVEALVQAGHECVEVTVPDPGKPMEIFMGMVSADKFKTLLSSLGSDPQQPELTATVGPPKLFGWMRSMIAWTAEFFMKDKFLGKIVRALKSKPVDEVYQLVCEKERYAESFYKEVWDTHQLDGIICPVSAMPALPHGAVSYVASTANATILYNVVDSPVGTLPVTRVDPVRDVVSPEWSNPSIGFGHGSPLVEGLLYRGSHAFYNAQKMAGLPVGVQIVGRKWEEEKVIEMMKVVDQVLGERGFGPGSCRQEKL